jgi:hypothetical protein
MLGTLWEGKGVCFYRVWCFLDCLETRHVNKKRLVGICVRLNVVGCCILGLGRGPAYGVMESDDVTMSCRVVPRLLLRNFTLLGLRSTIYRDEVRITPLHNSPRCTCSTKPQHTAFAAPDPSPVPSQYQLLLPVQHHHTRPPHPSHKPRMAHPLPHPNRRSPPRHLVILQKRTTRTQ